MSLFGKTGIDLLQELLEQVKGGVYILETKYEKKTHQLLIAYGTIANNDNQPAPFSGVSVKVRVITDEELVVTTATENIKLNDKEISVSQNIVKLFWNIVSELSAELESRVQKILSQPPKSVFIIKSVDIVTPFGIDNRTTSVRVELAIGDRRYQEELPAFQIFYLGSKELLHYLLIRIIQHLCLQTFIVDNTVYVVVPPKSFAGNIPKFLQALAEVGMMDVLLEDEESVKLKLEALQAKIQALVKKNGAEIGLEKSYIWSEVENEFLIKGLELAYVVYLILGTPARMPITILSWVLEELADSVIKERLQELDLTTFYSDEEKLFKGLVELQTDEQLFTGINKGFFSNLYEMKVDTPTQNFKKSIQKTVQKLDKGSTKEKKQKKPEKKGFFKKTKSKDSSAETSASKKLPKKFVLFPTYDLAETELRIRELAKEVTICIVSESSEEINQTKFVMISQGVLQSIRNMMTQKMIWTANGWVFFQPGAEDQITDDSGKSIYKQIMNWSKTKERLIRKRWGLQGEYGVVSYGDVFSVFKKDNFTGVITELDNLFSIKQLFVRKSSQGLETWVKKRSGNEQQLVTIQMLSPLIEAPLKRKGMMFFWIKLKLHRMIQNLKGRIVLHGDLFRNIDFLDDILFIFNSRFGLEIPNSLLIEEIMTDLHAMENEGIIKRYLLSQHALTAIPKKLPPHLTERKLLILQMIVAISKRYEF